MNQGTIVVVEDDADDKDLLLLIFEDLKIANKIEWFDRCPDALEYLKATTDPLFIILSDVNLPGQSGIEFKREIDNDPLLRSKSIPFIFYSTAASRQAVQEAFTTLTVQGFFQKPSNYQQIKDTIHMIIQYWKSCRHPNSV